MGSSIAVEARFPKLADCVAFSEHHLSSECTPRMPKPCLCCDNNSGCREHLWSAWIHALFDVGAIRCQFGDRPEKILGNAEITVRTVCDGCNQGWMSVLESENIPHMKPMILDTRRTLNEARHRLVAVWAVKTSMVSDSMKGRAAPSRGDQRFHACCETNK
jgi:hypothetical protein